MPHSSLVTRDPPEQSRGAQARVTPPAGGNPPPHTGPGAAACQRHGEGNVSPASAGNSLPFPQPADTSSGQAPGTGGALGAILEHGEAGLTPPGVPCHREAQHPHLISPLWRWSCITPPLRQSLPTTRGEPDLGVPRLATPWQCPHALQAQHTCMQTLLL